MALRQNSKFLRSQFFLTHPVVVDGQLPDFLQYSEEVIAVVSVVSNMLQTIVWQLPDFSQYEDEEK